MIHYQGFNPDKYVDYLAIAFMNQPIKIVLSTFLEAIKNFFIEGIDNKIGMTGGTAEAPKIRDPKRNNIFAMNSVNTAPAPPKPIDRPEKMNISYLLNPSIPEPEVRVIITC